MDSAFSRPFTFDRVVRLVISICILAGLFLLLDYLQGVLLPFAIAWLLAYILQPFVDHLLRFVKNKSLAIFIVLFLILAFFIGFGYFMIPTIVEQFLKFKDIMLNNTQLEGFLIPRSWVDYFSRYSDINVTEYLNPKQIVEISKSLFPHVWNLATNSLGILKLMFGAFFVLIYLYFILRDQKSLNKGFIKMLPPQHKGFVVGMMQDLKLGMNLYFRRQSFIAFIDAILFSVGFCIIGMPMGIVMGMILGVLNMVPYLQYLGLPPCALLMALDAYDSGSPVGVAIIYMLIVFLIVQFVQDFYLIPKIMGNSMGLHPAIVLLSISVWGYMLGVLGMIISLPVTTILKSYYKRYVLQDKDSKVPFSPKDKSSFKDMVEDVFSSAQKEHEQLADEEKREDS